MKNKKKEILAILLIIIFVIAIVPKVFQNDTFYTITVGRDILKYGFDEVERYSWVEGLTYTSPHWLFDVVNYLIYNVFEFNGLYVFVLILACVQMLLFYWMLRKKNVSFLTSLVRNSDS